MVAARRWSLSLNGPGALAVVWLTWSAFTLVRIDGLSADLQGDLRWRWSTSSEDLSRADRVARGDDGEVILSSAKPLAAGLGDWVTFRGADREGVIRGVTITADWTANPPRQRWRHRVGPAWSSVIVVGDRLFTQEQHDDKEAVVCYDAATGERVWTHEDAARFWETVSGPGPRATPTFADGRLFTLGATGILNCLDAATGKRFWSREIAKDARAKVPGWGYSGSPVVAEGKVVVYAGGEGDKDLLAYSVADGELAWTAPAGKGSYSSPQLVTLGGKSQILFLADRGTVSVDPATGVELWRHGAEMPGAPRSVQAHVLGQAQLVGGSVGGTGVTRFDVTRDGDGWKAAERWTTNDMKPEFPDFVVHGGHAYGFDAGIFCCIELETGTRKWKGGRYGRGQVMLLADQPALLVLTEKGQAVLLAVNPEKREELGRFQALEGKTWNHPVIAHGRLYARNAEEMACYDLGVR
jgi:outer membrane protein assembly factor BamB